MKKISIVISFCIMTIVGRAQWSTSLNDGSSSPKFGTSNAYPLSFYTDSHVRMTLDANGRLGIGKSDPAAPLDVLGNGGFSGNLRAGAIVLNGDLSIAHTAATGGLPNITSFRAGTTSDPYTPLTPLSFHSVCDVNYTPPPNNTSLPNYRVAFGPQSANLFSDLLQITDPAQNASLSFGVLNGSGIIALEPITGFTGIGNEALKLNPGCRMDVNICEGGGYTKMFAGAGVVGDLNVSTRVKIGANPSGITSALEIDASSLPKGITVSNLTNPVFEVVNNGYTHIGGNINGGNAVLTVGQSIKNNMALSLTDNTNAPNQDFFNVYGNGYTEIKVYSPLNMPTPYGVQSPRVMTVRDMAANKDLFVIRADGKVYAREVEINTNTNFADYVFDKKYNLRSIKEVADFIAKNKHLPGFENGEYYEKNGMQVSGIIIKQQEKIEEQMLYIIQQDKRLAELELRIQAIEKNK